MSFCNFMIKGLDGSQERYLRNCHRSDNIVPGTSHSFNGKITHLEDDGVTKTAVIDEAITITTVSDKIRNDCTSFWSKCKKQTKITFTATLVGSLIGIASSILVGVIFPPFIPLAVVVGLFALLTFGSSFVALYRSCQAGDQLKDWADPIEYHAKIRQDISKNGFTFLLNNPKIRDFVTKKEMSRLWKSYLTEYQCKSIQLNASGTLQSKGIFVRNFFERGPFSDFVKKVLIEVDNSKLPKKFKANYYSSLQMSIKYKEINIQALKRQQQTYGHAAHAMKSKSNQGNPLGQVIHMAQVNSNKNAAMNQINIMKNNEMANLFPGVCLILKNSEELRDDEKDAAINQKTL